MNTSWITRKQRKTQVLFGDAIFDAVIADELYVRLTDRDLSPAAGI